MLALPLTIAAAEVEASKKGFRGYCRYMAEIAHVEEPSCFIVLQRYNACHGW